MVVLQASATTWEVIEEGTYKATVRAEEVINQRNIFATQEQIDSGEQPEFQDKVQVTLAIEGASDDAMYTPTLRVWLTPSIHERAKMTKFIKACGLVASETFDTADLVGRELQVAVEQYARADGTAGNKITAFMPMPKGAKGKSLF